MTDRAADIAQEVAANFGASLNAEAMADLVECIGTALRSYGDERLEEAAHALDRGGPNLNDDWSNWGAAEFVRSLKSQGE